MQEVFDYSPLAERKLMQAMFDEWVAAKRNGPGTDQRILFWIDVLDTGDYDPSSDPDNQPPGV